VTGVVHRPRPAAVTSAVIWAMSLIGNGPTYGAFTVKSFGVNVTDSYKYCGVEDDAMSVTVPAFFVVGYALPLTAISVLYVLIACHVRRHRRRVVGPARGGPQTARHRHQQDCTPPHKLLDIATRRTADRLTSCWTSHEEDRLTSCWTSPR